MHAQHHSKRLGLALALCLLTTTVGAESPALDLRITGLEDATGELYVFVYDSADEWLGDNPLLMRKVDIESARDGGTVVVQIELASGEYAISIIHDRNGNGELDTNFLGIPKEPVAISNNLRPKFGPPKYRDAAFQLGPEGAIQNIEMADM